MVQLKRIKTNKSLFIIGSLILLSGIIMAGYTLYNEFSSQNNIEEGIKNYYIEEEQQEEIIDDEQEEIIETKVNEKYNYIAILRIPKINLENGLVDRNSKYNNIKYNIMIHSESDNPEDENGNVILVAHSGSSSVSYFKNLDKLELNDEVYLDYNGKTYTYKLVDIYDIEKTGKASIRRDSSKSTITLITCRHGTNYQIVLIGELQ